MDISEAIGFVQYYGNTPAIDFLEDSSLKTKDQVNVLLCGTSDIRHILLSLHNICLDEAWQNKELNVYFHEENKENVARALLLFHILNMTEVPFRERVESFCDIYGNCLVRERSAEFISDMSKELDRLLTDEDKSKLQIKKLLNFSQFKYKDRDDLCEIFKSWEKSAPFNMLELRDQRLRYHYKERYDFRENMCDWDYQMGLKEDAPVIHWVHYRDWRQTGVAFEYRFSTHIVANKTMGSYVQGKKKSTRESCLVRGFWGDIVNSPYLGFGIETDIEPEKTSLFRIEGMQQRYTAWVVTEFNLNAYLYKLDKFEDYHYVDEEPKKKEDQTDAKPDDKKDKAKEKKEEEEKKINDKKEEEIPKTNTNAKAITDGKAENPKWNVSQPVMKVFDRIKFKMHPTVEEPDKFVKKAGLKNKFDVVVLGIPHIAYLKKPEFLNLSKDDTIFYIEKPQYFVTVKREERVKMSDNIKKLAVGLNLKEKPFDKTHHFKFTK